MWSNVPLAFKLEQETHTCSTVPSTLRVLVTSDLRGSGSTAKEVHTISASLVFWKGTLNSLATQGDKK